MSPNSDSACRQAGSLDCACADSSAGTEAAIPSAGAIVATAAPCRRCRRVIVNAEFLFPIQVKTHYKARIRPIKLLFPHLASLSMALVRRNVPITRMRCLKQNGQAEPGRRQSSGMKRRYYFDAVGIGSGWSDIEFK